MKKLVLLALASFIAAQLFSQNAELAVDFTRYGSPITNPGYINRSIAQNLIHEIERTNRYRTAEEVTEAILRNIEGTPFMNNEFTSGNIYINDGTTINRVMLRYNVFNDKMEVNIKEQLYELSEVIIKSIVIDERTFDYLPFQLSKKEDKGYLELIQDGAWRLYCQHKKKFKEAQPQKAMEDKPSPAKFKDLPLVYLLKTYGSSTAIGFRNKKELLNIFPEHKSEVQTYIKKNKLKLNDTEDLKEVLSYYNSL